MRRAPARQVGMAARGLAREAKDLMEEPSVHSTPRILVVCDRSDTAPLWGYILRQQGLLVILETRLEKAIERWLAEIPALLVIDVGRQDPLLLCKEFRSVSAAPILLLLPAYNEPQILDAYAAGVDDVVVKPISPTVFVPKVMAWIRRTRAALPAGLNLPRTAKHRLLPGLRCLVGPDGRKIELTTLELRLLQLLMSRPGEVLAAQELVESIWDGYAPGDHVLLKNVVYRLRRKVEVDPGNPLVIITVPGGYCFQD